MKSFQYLFILQDTSNAELIPEIFDSCRILYDGYYSLKSLRYHISTRSTTKAIGNFPPPCTWNTKTVRSS